MASKWFQGALTRVLALSLSALAMTMTFQAPGHATASTRTDNTIPAPDGRSRIFRAGEPGTAIDGQTTTGSSAASTAPAYLSLHFGRSMWTASVGCSRLPGAMTLLDIAKGLTEYGAVGTGHTIPNWTYETNRRCIDSKVLNHDVTYPSWADLAVLRDQYGWSFVSAGLDHLDMRTLTPEEQRRESCGSLAPFEAHGHMRAWGLFAPKENLYTAEIQADVVSTCFAYGRRYSSLPNVQTQMKPPWFQKTLSVNGGACSNPALACYDIPTPRRYLSRSALVQAMQPAAGQWSAVQVYHLVRNSNLTGDPLSQWDCTSTNPADHWTGRTELYCWNDYRAALRQIAATTVITDPATVATAWGRVPPFG